ncbi:hypothetical protein Poli38472_003435 [Pythium oligandrum]|uniref:Transmembrane protein n=1 Tax=Pythium oligandrum TaxID=41045 RepID=A0A8K1FBP9_PYTOL|nr:hypothetical protein Poli38472_003435 [Pythium oligandrum]|eukprot:TMW57510.1 hypothetical protein Poli38472_003435 [Pythium oligandrum]
MASTPSARKALLSPSVSLPMMLQPQESALSSMRISVQVHTTRLVLLTVSAIAVIAAVVGTINGGVILKQFESSEIDGDARETLVDDYNAYSANVASVFGRPIEMLVGMIVRVVVLRFATRVILEPNASWRVGAAVFASVAVLEYLILNGFNALNVQSSPIGVQPVISTSDLSFASTAQDLVAADKVTTTSRTFPESTSKNSIANTVLRNVILPQVMKPDSQSRQCSVKSDYLPRDDIVNYGFPIRAWQRAMLPVALEPQVLRVPINTDKKIDAAFVDKLPMNASRAASLFSTGVSMATEIFPWFRDYFHGLDPPLLDLADGESETLSLAHLLDLLPDHEAEESAQRTWFLEHSREVMAKNLSDIGWNDSENATEHAIAMEFAHVNISPSITFDAVSFEVELSADYLKGDFTLPNGTLYTDLNPLNRCGPMAGICLFGKQPYGDDKLVFDVPSQVNVLAACVNEDKSEDGIVFQFSKLPGLDRLRPEIACNATSNSSLFVVSVGKRLVADGLYENASKKAFPDALYSAVAVNVRKIYTFTIGRLAWRIENLSNKFNAQCNSTSKCHGLHYKLSDGKTLVASADTLPLSLLKQPTEIDTARSFVTLVQVIEPPGQQDEMEIRVVESDGPSDVLLPHNVDSVRWEATRAKKDGNCQMWIEDRVHNVINNHLYIEDTLQVSYTTAMFFLFQDGVAKEVIELSDDQTSLKFDENVQIIALKLSIPDQNLALTLLGCGLLGLGVAGVIFYSWRLTKIEPQSDPLRAITHPHIVAQTMLNENKFPSFFLQRELVDILDENTREDIEAYIIRALTLQHQSQDEVKERVGFELRQSALLVLNDTESHSVRKGQPAGTSEIEAEALSEPTSS